MSSGKLSVTRSVMPTIARTTPRNASADDGASKMGSWARPMDSPNTHTTAWSATVAGFETKKKPMVIWKRQSDVIMVFAGISAMGALVSSEVGAYICRWFLVWTRGGGKNSSF